MNAVKFDIALHLGDDSGLPCLSIIDHIAERHYRVI